MLVDARAATAHASPLDRHEIASTRAGCARIPHAASTPATPSTRQRQRHERKSLSMEATTPPRHAAKRAAANVQAHRQAQRGRPRFPRPGKPWPRPACRPGQRRAARANRQQLRIILGEGGQHASVSRRKTSTPPSAACGRPGPTRRSSSTSEMASKPLDTDSDQLLCAGVRWNCVRQQRHQRLHAVQQREGGKAAEEHGAVAALEFDGPLAMAVRGCGSGGGNRRQRRGGGRGVSKR